MPHQKSPHPTSRSSELAPLVDIVMPVFGRLDLAKQAVESIPAAAGMIPYRLWLVDNGSPGTEVQEWMHSFKSSARRVFLKTNQGYPGGVNEGAKRGSAPLIMVLTTDVYLEPHAIEEMVKTLDDTTVGIVGPMLLFAPGSKGGPPELVQHAGIAFNLHAKPFHIFVGWTKDHPKVCLEREMQAVTGACFITRRNLFMKLRGLNEIYGMGTYEDIEYCFLIRSEGRKVIFNPRAVGHHLVGASLGQEGGPGGFTLGRNESIFRANAGNTIQWDEWKYW